MQDLIKKLKRTTFNDYFHILKLLIAIPISIIFKLIRKDIWLISERKFEAKDNGISFFEYLNKCHPEIDSVYVIDKNAKDYLKVKEIGKTVSFGTVEHWIYYLSASKVISSQKNGKPNAAICYFLEINEVFKSKFYFLQHGITKDDSEWLYYENTKFKLFVCGALPEFNYIQINFGYPKNNICYTGFSRFDKLYRSYEVKKTIKEKDLKKKILIIPTWREWLSEKNSKFFQIEGTLQFEETKYFKSWKNVLINEHLNDLIVNEDIEINFFLHPEMQKYINFFQKLNSNVNIIPMDEVEISDLLIDSNLLITDYSSVFFDFVYMKKPVIFYQFDKKAYRENQYKIGYFDYEKTHFGESVETISKVFEEIDRFVENNFAVSELFLKEHKLYFELFDDKNSERIFKEIGGN
ncbi:CDP-glycerol glycerophosphotransferase family protein [Vagococcus fluvialis]|uniref:CDP-glycerol glycerophosphotransferase family protein n=1 Tax=Vagococcus fluvialis TaxID=2738 RepID=UPI003B218C90